MLINPWANADQQRGSSEGSDVVSFSQETGFWFVLHHVPTGPSAGMYSPGYSEHMPMGRFSNNRAHSNYRVSLHATGMLPSKKHRFLAPALRICKLLMPVCFLFRLKVMQTCLCLQIEQLAGCCGRALRQPASSWLLGTNTLPSAWQHWAHSLLLLS